jgi:hypothetical protein
VMLIVWIAFVTLTGWLFWGWSLSIFPLMVASTVAGGIAIVWFGFVCSRLA